MEEGKQTQQQVQQQQPKPAQSNTQNSQQNITKSINTDFIDKKIEGFANSISNKIEQGLTKTLTGDKTEGVSQETPSFDLLLYFNIKSLKSFYYSDYHLVAMIVVLLLCVFIHVIDMYPIIPISCLIGYSLYIIFLIVKEKLWSLMVQ